MFIHSLFHHLIFFSSYTRSLIFIDFFLLNNFILTLKSVLIHIQIIFMRVILLFIIAFDTGSFIFLFLIVCKYAINIKNRVLPIHRVRHLTFFFQSRFIQESCIPFTVGGIQSRKEVFIQRCSDEVKYYLHCLKKPRPSEDHTQLMSCVEHQEILIL